MKTLGEEKFVKDILARHFDKAQQFAHLSCKYKTQEIP